MSNFLKPLNEPFSDDVAQKLSVYPRIQGQLLALFRTFANSARFLDKGVPNLLDPDSPLPLKMREIVILRTCFRQNCEYEWGVHAAVFGEAADLTAQRLNDTCSPAPDKILWSQEELTLIEIVDQLCSKGDISPREQKLLAKYWSPEQQLEIFALCGTYHTVSFVANVAELETKAFANRFPEAERSGT